MIVEGTISAIAAWIISILVYNAYFHPLAKVPGPRWWGMTRLPWMISMQKGELVHRITEMHKHYGPAVRVAPGEVSFIGSEAFQAIHGYRQDIGQFPKDPIWHEHAEPGTASIMTADNVDHARIRKILNASFTNENIRKLESTIQAYVDKLVAKIHDQIKDNPSGNTINMVHLLNFVAFDIIGELTFHEDFGCLESGRLHPWIALTFEYFQSVSTIACVRYIPYLQNVLMYLQSSKSIDNQKYHAQRTNDAIARRMARKDTDKFADFADFVSVFQKSMETGEMTIKEIEATTVNLLIGGSEPIASTLSGTINYLLRFPKVLHRVVTEVRDLARQVPLTMESVDKLEYLTAVIKESLRVTPPIPCGIPRTVPPGGAEIYGHELPAGTEVSVHHYASYRSPIFWTDPDEFAPERWLDDPPAKYVNDDRATLKTFSLGPRRCIGERLAWSEMRMILANLLLHFDFLPATTSGPNTAECMMHWEKQKTFALWARDAFYVHAKVVTH